MVNRSEQEPIGSRLRMLRRAHRLSQREVADAIGVRRECISNYERSTRTPDYGALTRLADLFSVSVDHLLGRSDGFYRPPEETGDHWREPDPDQTWSSHAGLVVPPGSTVHLDSGDAPDGSMVLIRIDDSPPLVAQLYRTGDTVGVQPASINQPFQFVPATRVEVLGRIRAIVPASVTPHPPGEEPV